MARYANNKKVLISEPSALRTYGTLQTEQFAITYVFSFSIIFNSIPDFNCQKLKSVQQFSMIYFDHCQGTHTHARITPSKKHYFTRILKFCHLNKFRGFHFFELNSWQNSIPDMNLSKAKICGRIQYELFRQLLESA